LDNEARLYAELEARGIAFRVVEHHAVFTVDESRELNASLPGAHTKNLFLKDNGGQFWLVTVPGEIRVDLKSLPVAIGSKRLSFAKAEDLLRLFALTPGSVTPLGALNDAGGEVRVVLGSELADAAKILGISRTTGFLSPYFFTWKSIENSLAVLLPVMILAFQLYSPTVPCCGYLYGFNP